MSIQEISIYVGVGFASIGGIVQIIDRFSQPDIKASENIALIEQGCTLKHKGIDEKFTSINKELTFIKENHLKHIETDIKGIREEHVRLITILDERLPRKQQ